jgi:transglutaminase-like putative cysteine protease
VRSRAAQLLGVAALVAVGAGLAVRADDRILHEFVPSPGADEGTMLVSQGGSEPAAIVVGGEVIPPPEDGALTPDERPMTPQPGAGARQEQPGRRSPTFRPDRITELENTLQYFEVFAPAIAPYKRVTSLDAVTLADDGVTPVLAIARALPRTVVPVEGASAPAPDARPRDKFWGSVVLAFDGGTTLPLPSVAPESRVLTIRSEPETLLHVERDSADNFYVVSSTPVRGDVRLTFLMDAPRGYFSMPLSRLPSDTRAGEVAPLPASVLRRATTFAAELALRRGMPFADVIEALVAHFRAFEESDTPPRDTGDIFLDLARGKKGVCRHRAYAFVIVAMGLGVPARFLENEAHAWVEVKQPDDSGWMRIDLGGAANGIEAHHASDSPLYRSQTPDLLPRPEAFERSYSQQRDMQGLRADEPLVRPGAGGALGADPGGAGLPARPDQRPGGPSAAEPGGNAQASASGSQPGRVALALSIHTFYREVFRGRELLVTGRVTDPAGTGVAGQRIEVSLMAPRGDRALLLGVTVSSDSGDFRGSFGVPPNVPVGGYRLVVVTPGDARHFPAEAR